jgi:hypothetical protein
VTHAWVAAGYRTTAIDHGVRLGVDVRPVQRSAGVEGFMVLSSGASAGSCTAAASLATTRCVHTAPKPCAMIDFMARRLTGEATLNWRGT